MNQSELFFDKQKLFLSKLSTNKAFERSRYSNYRKKKGDTCFENKLSVVTKKKLLCEILEKIFFLNFEF